MTEIYENISDSVKRQADIIWRMALAQPNPLLAAQFLEDITNYYSTRWTEEEVDFLQFYFRTKMEMNNK